MCAEGRRFAQTVEREAVWLYVADAGMRADRAATTEGRVRA